MSAAYLAVMQSSTSQTASLLSCDEQERFEASLKAVSLRQPDIVDRIVRRNSNGTSLVSFPGAFGVKVLVDDSAYEETSENSAADDCGRSNRLLFKAFQSYQKLAGRVSANEQRLSPSGVLVPDQDPIGLLTGQNSRNLELACFTNTQICRALRNFTDSGRLVTCYLKRGNCTRDSANLFYSLVDFTACGPRNGLIILQKSTDGSRISLSLSDFIRQFSRLCLWS
jgi:hypothetical protein